MSWRHLMWPADATIAERLFRWVSVLGGLSIVVSKLLPSPSYGFPVINLLILWLGVPSMLLFPFLASHLMRQAVARRATNDVWCGLLRAGAAVLLLIGIMQALVAVLLLLLSQVSFEFEPRADGDSFFG
ncbi:hypothetical protein KBK19_06555 [Microvirga sp. STR05]|uniref:DUF4190 domain-containing protein n=1 Tax=Hymenobacter duratus TaxID=2771356 RepID=A0ABR8JG74_9BACT|nr:hypothetical protein [Hymenobacter duratus]MBD2714688.1 hypothetical protein [Hymenobacter duratus]MBR7949592.1 hypothetical protein [Microvirga sp. STR05]